MKVIVISHTHLLLSLAWRLKCEEHDVSVVVAQDEAEPAWAGLEQLPRALEGADKRDPEKVQQLAMSDALFVTDSRRWAQQLRELGVVTVVGPQQLGKEASGSIPAVTFGAWFDGVGLSARHLLVEDQGLWPGGRVGPRQAGGLTLVAPRNEPPELWGVLEGLCPALEAIHYRGLVRAALAKREDGAGFALTGLWLDWGWLHTQAFVAELQPSLGAALEGATGLSLGPTYTVVLPVSMAPWPGRTWGKSRKGKPRAWERVEVPEAARAAAPFFMGISFEGGRVLTGAPPETPEGGLVAVVRGSAESLPLARARALQQAEALGSALREPQFRPDVAQGVEEVLAALESEGLGLL